MRESEFFIDQDQTDRLNSLNLGSPKPGDQRYGKAKTIYDKPTPAPEYFGYDMQQPDFDQKENEIIVD